MSDIEIILVNDNSNDNTSLIIQKLAEEDQRIKIINNKKNMATLYSRNIGILNSKGKYIMNLDNDDLFMDFDVFDKIYEVAEKGNYDIIGFNAIDCKNYNPLITQMKDALLHDHNEGLTLYQPELTYFSISRDNKFNPNDLHVWGRLTKENIYKKAINNFGKNAIGEIRNLCFVTWNEDSAMSMALFKYAESYKFIQKYGIFHYKGKSTSSKTSSDDLRKYGELFFIDAVFDFSHNNFRGKKYSVEIIHKLIFPHINSLSEKNKKYLKAIIYKMLDCPYISFEDKKEIKSNLERIKL
jgi:glycosyltransferase involved in cell wall biosynthesis